MRRRRLRTQAAKRLGRRDLRQTERRKKAGGHDGGNARRTADELADPQGLRRRRQTVAAQSAVLRSGRMGLQDLHHAVRTRRSRRKKLATPRNSRGCAISWTSNLLSMQGIGAAAGQQVASGCCKRNRTAAGIRSGRRTAGLLAADAHRHRPDASPFVQAGKGHDLPRYRSSPCCSTIPDRCAAARSWWRRCVRTILRDAGALRREGRNPRLHHPRLKGGQSAREMDRRRQPPHPGRLNDLRHVIYKNADNPWAAGAKKSRTDDARRAC